MKRSGSTVTYVAAQSLVNAKQRGEGLGFYTEGDLLEGKDDLHWRARREDRVDVLKTHDIEFFCGDTPIANTFLVYSIRDLNEAAKSGIEKFGWNSKKAFDEMTSAVNDCRKVDQIGNSIILRYEDFAHDPRYLVEALANYAPVDFERWEIDSAIEGIPDTAPLSQRARRIVHMKRLVLRSLTALGINRLARRLGIRRGIRKRLSHFLNSVDPKTLVHKDHVSTGDTDFSAHAYVFERLHNAFADWKRDYGYLDDTDRPQHGSAGDSGEIPERKGLHH